MLLDQQIVEEEKAHAVALERELAEDETGELRDEILSELEERAAEVKRAIDGGLSPAEFAQAESLQKALEVAGFVVQKAWAFEHQNA